MGNKAKKDTVKVKKSLFTGLTVTLIILLVTSVFFAASYFKAVSDKDRTVSALTERVNELNTQVTELSSKHETLMTEAESLKAALEVSGEDASTLALKLSSLEESVKLLEEEKSTLEASLQTVEQEKNSLEQYKEQSSEEYTKLQNSYDELLTNYQNVNSQYRKILDQYEALSVQLKALDYIQPAENFDGHSDLAKVCYLTFDDGPSKNNTVKILDILKENGIKATFFVNKRSSGSYDYIYKRIVDEGHTIGNHTATHTYANVYTSVAGFMKEFNDLNQFVYQKTGVYPQVFRFPGGSSNSVHKKYNAEIMPLLKKALSEIGVNYYDWNINSSDANVGLQTVENIISASTNTKNRKRIIVLMHDLPSKTTTPEALPEVIRILKEQGYEFRALNNNVQPI